MSGASKKTTGKKAGEVLLSISDLAVDFTSSDGVTHAVRDVDLEICKGETLALVGESGSGKSVTALSILQLLEYPPASHPSGKIIFNGENLMQVPAQRLRQVRGNDISMIFQEPMTSLNPLQVVEDQIAEILSMHQGMRGEAMRARIIELLDQVGIDDPVMRLKSYPHQLSGGQRQRVMIAMSLANDPDLLIADEPTTALDVTVQAQILDLLKELQARLGMAILFITHDLGIVRRMADRICVMHKGEIVEHGTMRAIFDRPQHAYTKELLAAEPKGQPPKIDHTAPVVIAAEQLKVWFPIKRGLFRRTVGHIKAVDGVDISLRQGHTLGVVGESGSGKTTLGLALLRLISSEGPISFCGSGIDELQGNELRVLRGDMQMVFQDPYGALSPRMTIAEIVSEGLEVHFSALTNDEREAKVDKVLGEVGLDVETKHRYPHEFSGGQRQRISIARALILEPKLLVLDEPTSALDMGVQAQIIDLLRALQKSHDLSYLFISHDLRVVRALANEVIIMQAGKVVEAGPAAEIFTKPKMDYTKTLLAAALDD